MRLKHTLIAALFAAATAGPVFGQGNEMKQVAQDCKEAMEAGDRVTAAPLAAQLVKSKGPHYEPTRGWGQFCLTKFHGEAWTYNAEFETWVTHAFVVARKELRETELRLKKQTAQLEKDAASSRDWIKRREAELDIQLHEDREAAIERMAQRKQLHVRERTYIACIEAYRRDEVAALINPVCNPLFVVNGLPDS